MAQDPEYRIANIFLTLFDLCSTSVLLIVFHLHVMKITEFLILKYLTVFDQFIWEELDVNEAHNSRISRL